LGQSPEIEGATEREPPTNSPGIEAGASQQQGRQPMAASLTS